MSSLFLERLKTRRWACASAVALFLTCLSSARAADGYFQPILSVGGEYDSNRQMATNSSNEKSIGGYNVSVAALFGVRTPRSTTDVRPQIRYQAFPSNTQFDRTEGALDFKTQFKTQRSEFDLFAKYSRRDEFNSEFVNIGFDPFDPNPVPTSDTGQAVVAETRTQSRLQPSWSYRWSERTGIGVDLQYDDVRYSAEVPLDKQDYDDWQAQVSLDRRISPKTTVNIGPYVGRFKTKDGIDVTDTVGASVGVAHDWNRQDRSELTVLVERNDAEQRVTGGTRDKTTDWGLQFSTVHRGEISRLRVVIGRLLTPTGAGGRSSRDEVRGQFDRDLSARLVFSAALRAFRQRALSGDTTGSSIDRDAATAELSLQWMLTPTWSLGGGVGYNWQDVKSRTDSAHNNRVFLSVGYRGLDPKRRK